MSVLTAVRILRRRCWAYFGERNRASAAHHNTPPRHSSTTSLLIITISDLPIKPRITTKMQTRFRLLLIFISSLLIIGYLSTRIISFAHIFFTHAGIAITQAEIKDEFTRYAVTGGVDPRPQYIPRKIHQVYHDWSKKGGNGGKPGSNGGNAVGGEGGNGDWGNGPTGGVDGDKGVMVAENVTIPSDWDEVRATCRALNPDWEYTVSAMLCGTFNLLAQLPLRFWARSRLRQEVELTDETYSYGRTKSRASLLRRYILGF